MMDNARPSRITAAAGTSISRDSFQLFGHYPFKVKEAFSSIQNRHTSRSIAGSDFRPLAQYSSLLANMLAWTFFSSSVVGHPLKPTKDRRFGVSVKPPTI